MAHCTLALYIEGVKHEIKAVFRQRRVVREDVVERHTQLLWPELAALLLEREKICTHSTFKNVNLA